MLLLDCDDFDGRTGLRGERQAWELNQDLALRRRRNTTTCRIVVVVGLVGIGEVVADQLKLADVRDDTTRAQETF